MFNKHEVPPFLFNKQLFLLNKPKITTFSLIIKLDVSNLLIKQKRHAICLIHQKKWCPETI